MPDVINTREIRWTVERAAFLWDYYSRKQAIENQYFSRQYGKDIVNTVGQYINLSKFTHVIDYGSGPGFLLEHLLAWQNLKVIGIDFSKDSIDALARRFQSSPNFEGAVLVRDLPAPIEAGHANALFLIEVVEHLTDEQLQSTLAEANRLLIPGGYIVVTTPNEENLEVEKTCCPECGCIFHRWQHMRAWTADGLVDALSRAGFELHRVERTLWLTTNGPRWRTLLRQLNRARLLRRGGKLPHLLYIGRKC